MRKSEKDNKEVKVALKNKARFSALSSNRVSRSLECARNTEPGLGSSFGVFLVS